jgi:hypothetical protein
VERLPLGQRAQRRRDANWDDLVSVTVDGAHKTFDLDNALGYFPRYSPGYAPVC